MRSTSPTQSGKLYEETVPASEKEQEITKAESLGETGTDEAYNALLHKLDEAVKKLDTVALLNNGNSTAEDIIEAMQNVAAIQWNVGMLDQAQELQEEILSRLIQMHEHHSTTTENDAGAPPQHIDIATTMHTIGSIQSRLNNPHEAKKWFNASLSMKKDVLSNYAFHYEIGKTLNGLALIKIQLDQEDDEDLDPLEIISRLEEAENHYIHHGEDTDGEEDNEGDAVDMADHPHVASINENIAMVYRMVGDSRMALQRYEEALRIQKHWASPQDLSLHGNEHIMNLNIHSGDCLQGMKRFDEALERYKEALRLHMLIVRRESRLKQENENNNEQDDGVEDKSVVQYSRKVEATPMEGILRHNMGLMHAHVGRHDLSMEEYQLALDIKKSFGDTHPEVAVTMNAIGAMLATKGEGQSALAHFREALYIFRMHSSAVGDEDADEDVAQTKKNIELAEKTLMGQGGRGGRRRF